MELADGWQFRGFLGREWEWHLAKPWDAPLWLDAHVPGAVVDDLVRAGEVPDPYFERQSRLAEWVPERAWVYRRRLSVAEPSTLRFGGVDHACSVYLDARPVAEHEGAFTPFDVPVPPGEHLLAVVIHPAPESEAQVGITSRVTVHKSRMGYGWDFCPRFVHQGIWRPVQLEAGTPRDVFPRVRLDGGVGIVEADGEVLLRVEEPELWWPNGMGAQRLYEVDGLRVGFRDVRLQDDYSLLVNGKRTVIKGWNWVPVDALYGVPRPEKVERLLRLAAASGANLLRVWGGGLIETDELYDLCDELGLVVWQEFSQSSSGMESVPSADPAFVRTMVEDARRIVPRLRRHASLAIWCGGNELDGDDARPVLRALEEVVAQLDPESSWLATSPIGVDGERDLHGPWEHQGLRRQYELYERKRCLLHSEFGVEGMTNRAAHEAVIAEEHRWPADRTNPVYEHLGAWWNNAPLVQACFGGRIGDLETLRRASQWLQYDGLRYAVEARLRQGAGVIPWQLNEPFPNAWCTCSVDYFGEPKPAFWGVARAYLGAPSARFATCAWGGEDEVRVVGSGRIVDLHGNTVAEGEDEIVASLDAIATDVFLVDLHGANRYVMTKTENLAPLLDLPRASVEVHEGVLVNAGDVAAIGIVLADDVVDLLPGESRAVGDTSFHGWNV